MLNQLPNRDLWLASTWKQLDAYHQQKIFGVPCPAPPGTTMLRSQLRFTQTYTSCIDQLWMFALSAAMSFVVVGADC
jgi:hypothetical protein